ncbi:hypothetical protein GW937_01305 [Candidatus Kaiserbacteria bacterium]|nr:hypothetical protein [Candidatus Kaiserbacteria bacterium]NCT01948.1 hypothetical protein [Candidatus Parcubacteria bacterium]
MKKITLNSTRFLLSVVIVFFTFSTLTAVAAGPYGRYGWTDVITSIDGTDTTTCGVNEVALTLELRDRNTKATTTADSAVIAVRNATSNEWISFAIGSSNDYRIGPVCFDPVIHSVAYDVDGGSNYRDFFSSFVYSNPEVLPRQRAMTGTVWLTPVGEPYEYQQISPSPLSVMVASSSPEYRYAVNYIHDLYGASTLTGVNFFLYGFDPTIPDYTSNVLSKPVNQSGGVGIKAIPPEVLADGWYGWSLYIHLNINHLIGEGVQSLNVSKSGFLNVWEPFVLDTTAPTYTSLSHLPIAPLEDETVTFRVDAGDVLTGVTSIEIFVDGVSIGTCSYALVENATCFKSAGPFDPLENHSYYAVAKDYAGNISTSPEVLFSVTLPTSPDLNAGLPTVTPGSVVVGQQITIEGTISNTGTAVAGPYDIGFIYVDVDGSDPAEYSLPVSRVETNTGIGSSQTISIDWTVPVGAVAGSNYRVGYFADVNNEIIEDASDSTIANWSGWSAPFTVTVPPTATLSGSDCDISVGESTCEGEITWNINDAADPNVYNETTGVRCSSNPGGTNELCTLAHGNNAIQARDGNNIIQSQIIIISAICSSEHTWDLGTNQCILVPIDPPTGGPAPTVWLRPDSKIIRSGASTTLQIGIITESNMDCILYGAKTAPSAFVHVGSIDEQLYSTTTEALTAAQIVRLTCNNPLSGVSTSTETRIEVIPSIQEL